MTTMNFDWTPRTIGEWRELLAQCPQANWMQSWPYAHAVFRRDFKASKLAVIRKDEAVIGMMAIQEIKLGPLHFVELHRGPLFFQVSPSEELFKEFAELFRRTYPKSLFRRVRCLPEWKNTETSEEIMRLAGFQKTPMTYHTIWIDLTQSEENLRLRLKQKWRHALNKSERSGIEVKLDPKGSNIEYFLQRYEQHKRMKNFIGPTSAFIKEEYEAAMKIGDAFTIWAKFKDQLIAGILVAKHGKTASYRIGWNSDLGRETNAHYLMLWNALLFAKESGCLKFDLGGVKPEEDPGVNKFKQGMGGEQFEFLGIWK